MAHDYINIDSITTKAIFDALDIMAEMNRKPLRFEAGLETYCDIMRSEFYREVHYEKDGEPKLIDIPLKKSPEYEGLKIIIMGEGMIEDFPRLYSEENSMVSTVTFRQTGDNLRTIWEQNRQKVGRPTYKKSDTPEGQK